MRLKRVTWLVAMCAFLVYPVRPSAQTVTSGSIAGVVKDTTGAVLPGVTVEASSPALIEKVRTVVTDAGGQYKVVDLRPGAYTVTFTLTGFSTVKREGIELATGFTASVNAELRVGALEETIIVSGASPVVDVQNVISQNVLSRERLDAVPTNQALSGLAALTLGVSALPSGGGGTFQDVGGNKGEQVGTMGVHGSRGTDMVFLQDGMRMQHVLSTGSGVFRLFNVNQVITQELVVVTAGASAESQSGGVQVNTVPKDGGNRFQVYGMTSGTNGSLQSRNVTDALRARGVTTAPAVKRVYDAGIGLGGPIKRDKLWFYMAHRVWGADEYVAANYYNKTQGTFFYTPDLSRPAYRDSPNRDHSLRLTWQAAQKHKVTIFPAFQSNCNCHRNIDRENIAPEASTNARYTPLINLQTIWTYPATNRLMFQGGAFWVRTTADYAPTPEVSNNDIAMTEASTGYKYNSRGGLAITDFSKFHTPQVNGLLSVSFVTGSHAFKTGLMFRRGYSERDSRLLNDPPVSYTVRKATPNALPVPVSLTEFASPHHEKSEVADVALYSQDQWTLRRLTLNLGLRFDYLHAWNPAQTRPGGVFVKEFTFEKVDNVPNWKDLSPRLGAAYDLFGNGKTGVKVSVGRYLAAEATSLATATNPANAIVTSATRNWTDSNGNWVPDCNLFSPLANNECGALSPNTFGTLAVARRYAEDVLTGWGVRGYNWQTSASFQHELRQGVGLSVGYFRTWFGNFQVTDNLAVTPANYDTFCVTAPADVRLPGGGGKQLCGFYDIKPAAFGQTDNLVAQASHYGKPSEVFNGVDINLNGRFGRGGVITGGVSTGRTVIDNCYVLDSPDQRFCKTTMPWAGQTQVKVASVYPLPWNFSASAVFQNLAGLPILATGYSVTNAQVSSTLGRDLGSCRGQVPCNGTTTINNLLEPNTRFEDRFTQVDLRLSKNIRVGVGHSVRASFDVYNVLNANAVLNRNNTYGSSWGTPVDLLGARLLKLGVQVDF